MIRIKKIVYPTDFSSYSNQAYFHAIALAENHGASLTVLYVYSPEVKTPVTSVEDDPRRYWQDQLEQIRPTNPSIPVQHVCLQGDPAREIVRYCREVAADLIVMGTHGRTGVERTLMGSVAEKVLRDATCSVLVAKLPRGQTARAVPGVEMAVSPV